MSTLHERIEFLLDATKSFMDVTRNLVELAEDLSTIIAYGTASLPKDQPIPEEFLQALRFCEEIAAHAPRMEGFEKAISHVVHEVRTGISDASRLEYVIEQPMERGPQENGSE